MRPPNLVVSLLLSLLLLVPSRIAHAAWTPAWNEAYFESYGNDSSRFQTAYDPFDDSVYFTNASSHSVKVWTDGGLVPSTSAAATGGSTTTTKAPLWNGFLSVSFVAGGRRGGWANGALCHGYACETTMFNNPRGLSPYFGRPERGISGIVGLFVSDATNNCIRFLNFKTGYSRTASGFCHPFDGAGFVAGSPLAARFTEPGQMATMNRYGRRVVVNGNCVTWLTVFKENADEVTLSAEQLAGPCVKIADNKLENASIAAANFPGGHARSADSIFKAIAAAFSPSGDTLFISDMVASVGGGIRKISPADRVLAEPTSQQVISRLMGRVVFAADNEQLLGTKTLILGLDILQDFTRPFLLVFTTGRDPLVFGRVTGATADGIDIDIDWPNNSSSNSNSSTNHSTTSSNTTAAMMKNKNWTATTPSSSLVQAPPGGGGVGAVPGYDEAWTVNMNPKGIISALRYVTYICRFPCPEVTGNKAYNGYNWWKIEKPNVTTISESLSKSRSTEETRSVAETETKTHILTNTGALTNTGNASTATQSKTYMELPDLPLIRGLNGAAYLNGVFLFIGALFYTEHWAAALALSRQRSTVRVMFFACQQQHRKYWTAMMDGGGVYLPWQQRVLLAFHSTDPLVSKLHDEETEPRKPPFADSPTQMSLGDLKWARYSVGSLVGNSVFAICFLIAATIFHSYRFSKKQTLETAERKARLRRRKRLGLDVAPLQVALSEFPISLRDLIGRGGFMEHFVPFVVAWLFPPTMSAALMLCARDWLDIYGLRITGIVLASLLPLLVLGVVAAVMLGRSAPRVEVWKVLEKEPPKKEKQSESKRERRRQQREELAAAMSAAAATTSIAVPGEDPTAATAARLLDEAAERKQDEKDEELIQQELHKEKWVEWLFLPRGEWEIPPDLEDAALRVQEQSIESSSSESEDGGSSRSSSIDSSDEDGLLDSEISPRQQPRDRGNRNGNNRRRSRSGSRRRRRGNNNNADGNSSGTSTKNASPAAAQAASLFPDASAAAAALEQLAEVSFLHRQKSAELKQQGETEFYAALPLMRPYMANCLWMLNIDLLSQLALCFAEFVFIFTDDNMMMSAVIVLVAVLLPTTVTLVARPYTCRYSALQVAISAVFQVPCLVMVMLMQDGTLPESAGTDGIVELGNIAGGLIACSASIIAVISLIRWVVLRIRPSWIEHEAKIRERYARKKERRRKRREAALAAMMSGAEVVAKRSPSQILEDEQRRLHEEYTVPGYELDDAARRREQKKRAAAAATVGGGGLARLILKKKMSEDPEMAAAAAGLNGHVGAAAGAAAAAGSQYVRHRPLDPEEEAELHRIRSKIDIEKRQKKFAKRNPNHDFFKCEYPAAYGELGERELEAFMSKEERRARAQRLWQEIQQEKQAERRRRLIEMQEAEAARRRQQQLPPDYYSSSSGSSIDSDDNHDDDAANVTVSSLTDDDDRDHYQNSDFDDDDDNNAVEMRQVSSYRAPLPPPPQNQQQQYHRSASRNLDDDFDDEEEDYSRQSAVPPPRRSSSQSHRRDRRGSAERRDARAFRFSLL